LSARRLIGRREATSILNNSVHIIEPNCLRSNAKSRTADRERGFTLIELSFVALLLALLGSIIYGSITTLVRTKNVLESSRVAQRTAEAVMTRISKELENRYAQPLRSVDNERKASRTSGGDADDEITENSSLLIGRTRRIQGVNADSIRLVTLGNPGSANLGNPGLIEVQYSLSQINNPQVNSLGTGPLFSLIREEGPADVEDQRIFNSRTFRQVLSDRVRSLQFRYRFNKKWVNQWSTKRETFPDVVEITLGMAGDSGGDVTYRTAVSIYRADE
jgi:prepilin-type N-terminal cleavage/methylation domain-containing protein